MCDDHKLPSQGRKYAGRTSNERAFQRRTAILRAALELFGTAGYAATSVTKICHASGLAKRYFYEAFIDREDCLASLYLELVDEMTAATLRAIDPDGRDLDTVMRDGIGTFVTYLTDDPRRARVVLIEVVGVSPAMETRRHGVLQGFADIVTSIWTEKRPDGGAGLETAPKAEMHNEQLTAITLVGGVNHLLVAWLMNGCAQRPDDLVEVCAVLFSAVRERLDNVRTA